MDAEDRPAAEEAFQGGHEVAGGQTVQVQQRQQLGHLRRLTAPRRQDHRPKPLALSRFRVDALVISPRRPHLNGAGRGHHLPRLRMPVAHDQASAPIVALLRQLGQVGVDLRLQRGAQHPPRTFPHHINQQRDVLTPRPILGDYSQHRAYLPDRRANVGLHSRSSTDHREGTPFPARSTGLKHFSAEEGRRAADPVHIAGQASAVLTRGSRRDRRSRGACAGGPTATSTHHRRSARSRLAPDGVESVDRCVH
jgi:hypothetical protein